MPHGVTRPVAITAALLAVATLAASTADTALWVVSNRPAGETTEAPSAPESSSVEPHAPTSGDLPTWSGSAVDVLAVAILVVLGTGALAVLWNRRHGRALPGLAPSRWRRRRPVTELPEVDVADPALRIDVAAAQAALREGTPRNAVVACWMQLERDAAAAGIRRHPAETSAEYAVRIIRAASLDAEPIETLAAQYREARFSRHPLADVDRRTALATLERVVAALPDRRLADVGPPRLGEEATT